MRRRRGNAIAETGPALFMFLIIIFFPLLDVMGIAAQFACGWYHNHLMLQELSVRHNDQGGTVHNEIMAQFGATGLSKFAGITDINDAITYSPKDNTGKPEFVTCVSTISGKPFIALPFIGFTKTSFTISGEATREVTERTLTWLFDGIAHRG
jgi:hypothetical protein